MANGTKFEATRSLTAKRDPFQPIQPAIPGVAVQSTDKPKPVSAPGQERSVTGHPPTAGRAAESGATMGQKGPNKVLAAVVGAGLMAALAGMIFYTRLEQPKDTPAPAAAAIVPDAAKELDVAQESAATWPVAPGVIAKADELARPWSSKKFVFNDSLSNMKLPAMAVRLPGGGYWGFSLKEPFGSCDLEFVTDLQRLQSFYEYAADHPMIGDPCNKAVFDLLQYGGPSNAEVRGMLVHGMGVRPPIAIEIEQTGNEISALRMESE